MLLADSNQIRLADQSMIGKFNFPGILLMENAGRLTAESILKDFPEQNEFLILVGPGNNGGDGIVVARYLFLAGKSVYICYSHSPEIFKGDALINFQIIQKLKVPSVQFSHKEQPYHDFLAKKPMVIDALLGTGLSDRVRGVMAIIISEFRLSQLPTLAIDLPSGMNANSGNQENDFIPALKTYTYQLPKVCHFLMPSASLCGEIQVFDIGIYPEVLKGLDIRRHVLTDKHIRSLYRPVDPLAHKSQRGKALIAGGSRNMSGAIALSAQACLHSGAGLVTVLLPSSARHAVYAVAPEVMTLNFDELNSEGLDKSAVELALDLITTASVVAVGPGMGHNPANTRFLSTLLEQVKCPLVLDADALNILSENPDFWNFLPPNTVVTPHPGEMSRLMGVSTEEIQAKRLEYAEDLARSKNVTVVLKGPHTIIAFPDGTTCVNPLTNPGLATAGSGDVLTGFISSFLAQGYKMKAAASLGVYLHGKSATSLSSSSSFETVTAGKLISALGQVFNELFYPT